MQPSTHDAQLPKFPVEGVLTWTADCVQVRVNLPLPLGCTIIDFQKSRKGPYITPDLFVMPSDLFLLSGS